MDGFEIDRCTRQLPAWDWDAFLIARRMAIATHSDTLNQITSALERSTLGGLAERKLRAQQHDSGKK
jgi:hypothetical protein